MFNGATVLKDFNIAVCLKKSELLSWPSLQGTSLITVYQGHELFFFFRMRRRAKKTLRFRVTNAMVSVETSVLGRGRVFHSRDCHYKKN